MDELSVFKIKPGSTVIDLGAGTGTSTLKLSRMVGPNGLVISLTPVLENYRKLVVALVKNNIENVVPLMYAAHSQTGFSFICLSENPVSHSMIYPRTGNKRVVVTVDWHLLMDMLQLTHVDLALIDVEGCEVKVLESMADRLGVREPHVLPDKIVLEEHLRHEQKPQETLSKIYELLDTLGYTKRIKKEIYIFAEHESTFSDLRKVFLRWLKDQSATIKGQIYNLGSGPDWFNYARFFPKATSYFNVDQKGDVDAHVVADVQNMKQINKATAQCVLASFLLECVENVDKALAEIHRILKPNGVLLATFTSYGYLEKLPNKFTETEVAAFLAVHGFHIEEMTTYADSENARALYPICFFVRGIKKRRAKD